MNSSKTIGTLHFASALSTLPDPRQALDEVCRSALEQLGEPADLAMLFLSHAYGPDFDSLAVEACRRIGTNRLLGCTAEALVGMGQEVEGQPAMSLWLARLPGVSVTTMHLRYERSPEGGAVVGWPANLPDPWPDNTFALMLGEPFSFPASLLLENLNQDHAGAPVVGGMASGGARPGANRLLAGPDIVDEGAVLALLSGPFWVRTVVSQGCRPVGRPLVITRAEKNVIHELGGKPALTRLQEVFRESPTYEQRLMQKGLHVGRVVSEYQEHFQQGDFLVRNVVGIDRDSGAITICDLVRPGQTVQFQVRDQETADYELQQLLAAVRDAPEPSPAGGLLFTCNGRGARLFDQPHHDAGAVQRMLGDIPLAGFFAAGEIGPIGGQNFLHGFTASMAFFEPEP